jgi:hypothetical protein
MIDELGKQSDQIMQQRDRAETQPPSPLGTAADIEMWLQMSREAQDSLLALEYVQRASELNPDDPRVQASLQQILFERLKNDPFVAFLAEMDTHYVVTFRQSRPVLVPKRRAKPEIFPPTQRTEGERVLGMVWWIALGFILGGVGAFIASVLVLRRAFRVLKRRDVDDGERRLAWLAVLLATGLGLVGEFFTLLLVLHFMG